ncbi:hypothetical protein [Streptomyces sp. NPDC000851]
MPIPGTRRLSRLEENLAAADLELSADDLPPDPDRRRPGRHPGRPLPRPPGTPHRQVIRRQGMVTV